MIRKLQLVAICVLLCAMSAETSRQTPPGTVIWEPPLLIKSTDEIPKGSVPKNMVERLSVSDMTIALEQTKLADVQAHFGASAGERGDAGEYIAWVCLNGTTGKERWILWLMSSEIDAGTVGGFQWLSVPPSAQVDRRCGTLVNANRGVELPIAIRLGMREGRLLHILGQPTARLDDKVVYVHEEERTIRNEPCTELNILALRLRDGVVHAIEVWKSTAS